MSPISGDPSGGEPIDRTAGEAIRLAHRALERFPDVVRRHKFVAGGAVVSSSLIALAGVAIARRIRAGQSADEAVAGVTAEEVQGLRVIEPEAPAAEEPEPAVDAPVDDDTAPEAARQPA
ncbi:MAG: hypothetical protein AB7L91_07620 [Dehalococcoidia bacterium]